MGRRSRLSTLLPVLLVIVLAGVGYTLFKDMTPPVLTITPRQERVSPTLNFTVKAVDEKSAIKKITVIARRSGRIIPILDRTFTGPDRTQQVTFTLQDTGIKDAAFDLEISATDDSIGGFGRGNTKTEVIPMRIDTTPPRMTVKTSVPYVRRGGTACVLYSISKDVTQTGVKVGNFFFPGFRQQNGDYLCFFAFPYFLEMKDYSPQLVAVDTAGNAQVSPLPVTRMNRVFKRDSIILSQNFIDSKAEEFSQIVPGNMPEINRFLLVNGNVRKSNAETLMEIGKDTSPEILWKEAFMRLPNSASRAGFADHRTYNWQGQKVDEQTHLGFDLASTAQAEVPAANNGRVVYTGYLGIYGNLIVIDHGLGLQSLYSHLSQISVQKGQTVQKGDIIGHTGATGMAGGDHLHFGILIAGLEVTPLEWLDSHWIKDNVIERIKAVGGTTPAFTPVNDGGEENSSPATVQQPSARSKPPAKASGKVAKKPGKKR